MKKVFTLVCFCMAVVVTTAQNYTNAFGVVAGMENGLSYKHLNNHTAFQTDLAIGINYAPIGYGLVMNCWDFRVNPNIAYQGAIKSTDTGTFAGFIGGGLSLGEVNSYLYNMLIGGVFGINAIAGLEYAFNNAPISFGFDFRPGYGLFFDSEYALSSFDWKLNLSIRYCW